MGELVKVLVVNGEPSMTQYLKGLLVDCGYQVFSAHSGKEGLERARLLSPALVLLDADLPDMNCTEVLKRLTGDGEDPAVLILSASGHPKDVVQAMKLGAADFVVKPFDPIELRLSLARILEARSSAAQFKYSPWAPWSIGEKKNTFIFGNSEKIQYLKSVVEQVADTDITVLVTGESGSGKELVARSLHQLSSRRTNAFVKVNCAALPGELLESELFGYEKGSFTGAGQRKLGKFELADKGTIFLDEISEMSSAMQAKLLQVLQDGEFSRLGGGRDIKVDARVISATNKDLRKAVAEGGFREDLFYRLNVVGVHVPPLRERRDEIPLLTEYFMRHYSALYYKEPQSLSSETLELFLQYYWPGNVRELENIIKRIIVLDDEVAALAEFSLLNGAVPEKAAPSYPEPSQPGKLSLREVGRMAARIAEREAILRILRETRWNRKKAAQILKVSYKALLYKIKDAGLDGEPGLWESNLYPD